VTKLPQHVSGLGALGEAVDGTPAKRRRGERKANPNGTVESDWKCRCHEQVFPDYGKYATHLREVIDGLQSDLDEARDARHPITGRRLVARCGTWSGLCAHHKRAEPPCDACVDAGREYSRNRKSSPEYKRQWGDYHKEYNRAYRARKKAEREAAKGDQQAS
jgi:hypothetical protein